MAIPVPATKPEIKSPLELYKLLKKTNCGECYVPSCMAFAVAVLQGRKRLRECPYIGAEVLTRYEGRIGQHKSLAQDQEETVEELKRQVAKVDFAASAERLGARLVAGSLTVNCLGKDFLVNPQGELSSECHCNNWVLVPLLHYILHCKGGPVREEWVPFGELRGSADWVRFFSHRSEDAFRQLADTHQDFVFETLTLFGAKSYPGFSSADHSLLLFPLPKVPILICYWPPEESFDSTCTILFDRSAETSATPEAIYLLCRGIVEMLRRLIDKHADIRA